MRTTMTRTELAIVRHENAHVLQLHRAGFSRAEIARRTGLRLFGTVLVMRRLHRGGLIVESA